MAASVALLSLLTVSLAEAAPRRAAGPICDPQTPVARKLPRHPRSFGGPVKRASSSALADLQDLATARLRRGTHAFLGENAAVIQNDTPVNETDGGDRLIPSLRPLEIIGAFVVHPRSRAFSPRSPRGPPLPA